MLNDHGVEELFVKGVNSNWMRKFVDVTTVSRLNKLHGSLLILAHLG